MTENPIEVVQKIVADAYEITVADLVGDSRREPVATARMHAVHLCAVLFPGRSQGIATAFGYTSHSSAVYASQVILGRVETETWLDGMHRRLLGQCMAAIDAVQYARPWAGDTVVDAQCNLLDALHNLKIAYAQMAKDPAAAGYRIDTALTQLTAVRAAIGENKEVPS